MAPVNKLPENWLTCPKHSDYLLTNKFIVFKTPLDAKFDIKIPRTNRFTPHIFLEFIKTHNIKLSLWIDLTNTDRYYNKNEIVSNGGISYVKIKCAGHKCPPTKMQTNKFIKICDNFIRQHPLDDIIGVHCTHGFNRTGFLLVSYMVEKMSYNLQDALQEFANFRPPGIYRERLIKELYRRYDRVANAPIVVLKPDWFFHRIEPPDRSNSNNYYSSSSSANTNQQQEFSQSPIFMEGFPGITHRKYDRGANAPNVVLKPDLVYHRIQPPDGSNSYSSSSSANTNQQEFSQNPIFMEEVPGIRAVVEIEIINSVRLLINNLAGCNDGSFVGSKYILMDTNNLRLLSEKPYKVSWEANGMRCMMLIRAGQIYLLDENNKIFLIDNLQFFNRNSGQHLTNTLLDGEIVIDKIGNKNFSEYLISDIVSFEGNKIGDEPFYPTRLGAIDVEIIQPRIKALQEGRLIEGSESFIVNAKKFYDLNFSKNLLSEEFAKKLARKPDGLIYHPSRDPYIFGQTPDVLKWKPSSSLNTVVFFLEIQKETRVGFANQFIGILLAGNQKLRFGEIKCTKAVRALHGKFVECKFENNQWILLRKRTDKLFPDSYETANAVLENSRNEVTKKMLLYYINNHRWIRRSHNHRLNKMSHT